VLSSGAKQSRCAWHDRLAVQFINLVMLFIYKLQHSTAQRSVTGRMCRTGRAVVKRQKSETSFTVIIIGLIIGLGQTDFRGGDGTIVSQVG
jgi:hypothetical protein